MDIYKSSRKSYFLNGFLAFMLLSLLSLPAFAANFPLQIIQPQPNLDTKNRFYKAYPGFNYNVRLAVIGGEFPFSYELTSAPQGMVIDNQRGEITWANPSASATVTAKVTDAQANTKTVTWSITVTTNGFRFIDAINGKTAAQGGTGFISSPWKSMRDLYEGVDVSSKSANSYAGEFIYWRSGTYTMDAYREVNNERVPFVGNNKPMVWLAYPGDTPVFNMAAAFMAIYGGGSNIYFDGLTINVNDNNKGKGIAIGSNSENVTFRKNKMYGISNGVTGGNSALVFITKNVAGRYYAFQDNEMYNVGANGYGILGYSASHVLIENNTFYNINQHPVGPKEGTAMWFIRANRFFNNPRNSINLQYSNSSGIQSGNIEISYNLVESGGGTIRINSNQTDTGLPVYIFRNTFMDDAQQNRTTSTNGFFSWYENVIVNNTSFPEKIERFRVEDPSRVLVTNNLTGSTSDNILDSQGFLTQGYSMYIGSRGHQLGNRISAPTALVVTQ